MFRIRGLNVFAGRNVNILRKVVAVPVLYMMFNKIRRYRIELLKIQVAAVAINAGSDINLVKDPEKEDSEPKEKDNNDAKDPESKDKNKDEEQNNKDEEDESDSDDDEDNNGKGGGILIPIFKWLKG